MYWIVELSSAEHRYSKQILDWVVEGVSGRNRELSSILHRYVATFGIQHFKSLQLTEILRLINENEVREDDVFIFLDSQFPGIESVRSALVGQGIKPKMFGFCNSGSFAAGEPAAKSESYYQLFEHGYWNALDVVFTATQEFKDFCIERTGAEYLEDKMVVLGPIWDTESVHKVLEEEIKTRDNREYDFVFSHPFEKHHAPSAFIDFLEILDVTTKDKIKVCVINTEDHRNGKDRESLFRLQYLMKNSGNIQIEVHDKLDLKTYYRFLNNSKYFFSSSQQDFDCYRVLEACAMGCHPLVWNTSTGPEILGEDDKWWFVYDGVVDAVTKYGHAKDVDPYQRVGLSKQYDDTVDKMIDHIEADEFWDGGEEDAG